MELIGLERAFAAILVGELTAASFLIVALVAHAIAIRFPSRSPYGDHTQRRPGARFHREVIRARGQAGAMALSLVVFALATVNAWLVLPTEVPFATPWWAHYALILHVIGLAAIFGVQAWRVFRRWRAARVAWHANLAIGHLAQRFALAGHRAFHEVTVNGLIIDHVLVGPRGVFLVNVTVRPRRHGGSDEVRLLPVERQLDLGGAREFEPVFDATRRVTETGKQLAALLGHAQRPVSAIVVPGWKAGVTVDGEHLLFDLSNFATLLGWAKPANGLLNEDLVKVHDFLLDHCRDPRPV